MTVVISFLNHTENQGNITGMRVTLVSLSVSHLLFVDDSFFFYKAESCECDEVMKAVNIYGKASGHSINFNKSSLFFFFKRVLETIKQEIKATLDIKHEGGM